MIRSITLGIVTFALLVLGACAPTTSGGSASNALTVDFTNPFEVIEVSAGSTWYITDRGYNPDFYGLKLSERNKRIGRNLSYNPRKGDKANAQVGNLFRTTTVETPSGWQLSLRQVMLERTVTDVDHTTYSYSDSLRFTFAAAVPATTAPGIYTALVSLRDASGDTKSFTLRFKVS